MIASLTSEGVDLTIDQFIEKVENPVKDTTLFSYFQDTINSDKEKNNLGSARVFSMTLNSIKKFNKDIDVKFTDVNLSFLKKYEAWLKKNGLKDTTISIYFRTLRMLINRAIGEGYMKQADYPFGKKNENTKFNISKFNDKTEKRAITEAELKAIEEAKLESHLELAREYFLCSYYMAGINFNDLCKLRWNDLKDNRVSYTRTKTGVKMTTMLLPFPKSVIAKYKLKRGIDKRNYIFPVLEREIHKTPQQIENRIHKILGQVNKNLKEIAKQVGIKDKLTTYVARHSFITHMANSGKVTPFDLMNMVGHKDLKTTMIYYKGVDQKKQDELMQKVFNSA
jgi:integrase